MNNEVENLSQDVEDGKCCRFCEKYFLNHHGQQMMYQELTICRECRNLMHWSDGFTK